MEYLPLNPHKVDALIKQCRHLNVFPYQLDFYYPPTESHPVADILAELVAESVQDLECLSDDEIHRLIASLPPSARVFTGDAPPERPARDQAWMEHIAVYYLIALVAERYLAIKDVVANVLKGSVLLQTYPELEAKFDGDGLLWLSRWNDETKKMEIDKAFTLFDGGIVYKDHILHYHQFLRRGYHSNPNFDFLDRFRRYYLETRGVNEFRIAVDYQRLMPREFYQHYFEKDGWFSPTFDRSTLDDPHAIGLTIIRREQPSLFDRLTAPLDRTEFYWSFRDGVKTFEIEEVARADNIQDAYYLNRYVHSEREIGQPQQFIRHFDGAVKVYLQDSYPLRLAAQMPREPKCYRKPKLFRIDRQIDIDVWIDLMAHFYKGNEMITQYFNPVQFEEIWGEKIRRYRSIAS